MDTMDTVKKRFKISIRIGALLVALTILFLTATSPDSHAKSKKKQDTQVTAKELQAALMSYADLVSTIVGQILYSIKKNELPPDVRMRVLTDMTNTVFSIYTNAAEPNPLTGLLDTAVIVSFGKMIYEQHWLPKYGAPIQPVVKGFRTLDETIWEIVSHVLNEEHENELRNLILERHENFPFLLDFSQIRFMDFANLRKESPLSSQVKSGGFFAPVSDATKQIEESRQLAERALFLATRLPLTIGKFMDVWLSQWLTNPEVNDMVQDLKKMSTSTHELTSLVEKLPSQLEQLSTATVNQTMDRISLERENIIKGLETQQDLLAGLATELRHTANAGQALTQSMNDLAGRVGFPAENPVPFDIHSYRKTVEEIRLATQEMTALVDTLNQLSVSPEMERLLPLMKDGITRFSTEIGKIIDRFFLRALLVFVLSAMCFYLIRLGYSLALKRMELG